MTKQKNSAISQWGQPGERNYAAKLTTRDILEIRELFLDGASPKILAKNFRVAESTINRIISGRTWSHIQKNIVPFRVGGNRRLNEGQVLQIKRLSRDGLSSSKISKILLEKCSVEISPSGIRLILSGKRWKYLKRVSLDDPRGNYREEVLI